MDSNKTNVSPTFMSVPRVSNKRKSYKIEDKILFIELVSCGRKTQSEICNEYNISHSTLGTILSNKEKILQNYKNNESCASRKRNRGSKHDDIERLLIDWYKEITKKGIMINGTTIRAKAGEFASFLNKKHDFKASNGWLQRFKARYNIQLTSCSSAISGDDESFVNKRARKDTTILDIIQNASSNNHELRIYKPSESEIKNGSLGNFDDEEEGEYHFSSEFTSNSNSVEDNHFIRLKDDDDDDEFNESECFQENSLEVPDKQEALNYLYKLRSFFESTEKSSINTMKCLDDIEDELLNL